MINSKFKTHLESRVEEVIDPKTGEILKIRETKTVKVSNVQPGDFYMVYLRFQPCLYKINSDGAFKLFSWLCSNINYGSTKVALNCRIKKDICKELDISMVSFIKYLKILKSFTFTNEENNPEHILVEEGGVVLLNPKFVWKGDPKRLSEFKITVQGVFDQNYVQPDDAPVDFTAEN